MRNIAIYILFIFTGLSKTVCITNAVSKYGKYMQTFGKRCQAVKRDPNCPVVIRGWLYKRSYSLKSLKSLSKPLSPDSREESVLGSIPLPSYRILYCSPRECRNRKYAFKVRVVHQGMRPYIMSAETQEDMLGWVRALSQSASMEADDIINR
uniref:Si:ch211-234p6.5 n=1 Tax=Sinocyclocheilus anshuiensis TaxID=1608454 RepID=A0A671LIM4_9TELE